jgi:CTP:molybdopterin cytidylyltransferase MocA
MPPTAGLVLAAGEGRRFGGPKAPFVHQGERLVDRAVRLLTEAGCTPIVVVLGAWEGDVPGARITINPDWPTGMGSSLTFGLGELTMLGADRVVVTLVDLVGLTSTAVARVVGSHARLAAAAYDGQRRHPVLLGHEHWAGVTAVATGDRGARDYLDAHSADVTLIEVGDVATDVDLDERPGQNAPAS